MIPALTLLRSTGPHAGLAALSAELWAAYESLPRPQRLALLARDDAPRTGENELQNRIALALSVGPLVGQPMSEARRVAQEALRDTRGILDPDGRVSR